VTCRAHYLIGTRCRGRLVRPNTHHNARCDHTIPLCAGHLAWLRANWREAYDTGLLHPKEGT
jgi:hypothetical protein